MEELSAIIVVGAEEISGEDDEDDAIGEEVEVERGEGASHGRYRLWKRMESIKTAVFEMGLYSKSPCCPDPCHICERAGHVHFPNPPRQTGGPRRMNSWFGWDRGGLRVVLGLLFSTRQSQVVAALLPVSSCDRPFLAPMDKIWLVPMDSGVDEPLHATVSPLPRWNPPPPGHGNNCILVCNKRKDAAQPGTPTNLPVLGHPTQDSSDFTPLPVYLNPGR